MSSSLGKLEGEQFDEVMCNIASILNAEPSLSSNTRKIEEQYYKMLGVRLPRFGMRSVADLLSIRSDLFDLRPMPNGIDYEIFLAQYLTEQGETMAKWNEKAARVRNKNSHAYYQSSSSSSRGIRRDAGNLASNPMPNQPAVVASLSHSSPKLQKFCETIKKALAECLAQGKGYVSLEDLIATGDPFILNVNPATYGAGGYFELLEMLAGQDFRVDVLDDLVVILPPK